METVRDKFQCIFENNPVPMVLRTLRDRRIIDVNKAYEKITGYGKEEVLGKTGKELGMFVESEMKEYYFETLARNKKVEDVQMKIKTKDGKVLEGVFNGEIIPSKDEDVYLTVMMDVTEINSIRRALTNKLEFEQILLEQTFSLFDAKETQINKIIDSILEKIGKFSGADRTYVFKYTKDLKIMNNTNEWCAEGVSPEKDNLRNLPTDIFPEWMKMMFRREEINIPEVDKLPDSWKTEREILQAQSIKSVVIIPIFSGENDMGFMGFDYTREGEQLDHQSRTLLQFFAKNLASALEMIEKNRKLKEATKKAEHLAKQADMANKAKSDFIANVSHEIRTPMNAIMGIAHLMDQTNLTTIQKRYLNIILNSGQSLVEIINDVLDISKMESGKFELRPEEFSVHKLIGDSIRLFELQAAQKGIEISTYLDPNIPSEVFGANVRMGQILNNLISNAIKYSSYGTIEIEANITSIEKDNIIIAVTVKDQGIGIKSQDLPYLFDEFWQGDTGSKNFINGTGLGLPISKKIAQMMGGEIKVKSKLGKGSEFTLQIPLIITNGSSPFEKVVGVAKEHSFLIFENRNIAAKNTMKIFNDWNLDFEIALNEKRLSKLLKEGTKAWNVLIVSVHRDEVISYKNLVKIIKESGYGGKKYLLANSYDLLSLEDEIQVEFDGILSKPVTPCVVFEEIATRPEISKKIRIEKSQSQNFSGAKVLIAEDIELNREIIRLLLKNNGIDADIAEDGMAAVKACEKINYDLVFMDIQMPRMNGIEATKKIKEISNKRKVPIIVIALSAYNVLDYPDFPMDDHMPKPIDPVVLKATLNKWIGGNITSRDMDINVSVGKNSIAKEILNVAEGIRLVGGDRDIYFKVLNKFANIYLDEKSKGLLDVEDFDALGRYLHGMKSAAGSLGATEVYNRILEIDKILALDEPEHDYLKDRIHELKFSNIKLKEQIHKYLKGEITCCLDGDNTNPLSILVDEIDSLIIAVSSYDPVRSKNILEKLKRNSSEELQSGIYKVSRHIESYDFENALNALINLKKLAMDNGGHDNED